ncbi:NAD-binding protein [Facilibium subflavum]|uniref:NAD-binding protein n=1 Tax=Facilibium subflavum TaxID=2219058 RepID=UPI000E64D4F5|nr:NAD-binding protein [Facilibium subflavum]
MRFFSNPSDKQQRYTAVFFAWWLFINGILSILVATLPFIDEALHTHLPLISQSMIGQLSLRVNTALSFIFGYTLLLVGRGIYKQLRVSWILALIMLGILFCNNLFIYAKINVINLLYLIEIIGLLLSWKIFSQKSKNLRITYSQFIIILSFIIALAYGVIGSYLLKDEFVGIDNWTDAIYFTVVTYSTIGYGNIHPVTEEAKIFVTTMVFFGLGSFAAMLTFIVSAIINRIQAVFQSFKKGKKYMKDHMVICGFNAFTKLIIQQLKSQSTPYILIDQSNEDTSHHQTTSDTLKGYAYDAEILNKANIHHAKNVIIAYDSDADNILSLLSIADTLESSTANKPDIVIRIEQKENIHKAEKLGAREIISPLATAAEQLIYKNANF